MRIALLLAAVGCSSPSKPAKPPQASPLVIAEPRPAPPPPAPLELPPVDLTGMSCGPDGKLHGTSSSVVDPSGRSAVVTGSLATEPMATLITCRGGLRGQRFHRDQFRDVGVDAARIESGLDQMSWFQFTPNGNKLVFAVTAHERLPNPARSPPYRVTTLVSKFVVVDVESFRFTTIDTKTHGFNSYSTSNDYIVFRGSDETYRADFRGTIVRLTPTGGQTLWAPQLSPDGKWLAEILRDESYVLTSVREPTKHLVLAAAGQQKMVWTFNTFSPDSSLHAFATVAAGDEARDFSLFVHDIATARKRTVLSIWGGYTVLMKVSPDNKKLLVYSFWATPRRASRLYCVDLPSGNVTVAPVHDREGNLYVDDAWTYAEIDREQGRGPKIPLACDRWPRVGDRIAHPMGAQIGR